MKYVRRGSIGIWHKIAHQTTGYIVTGCGQILSTDWHETVEDTTGATCNREGCK